MASKLPIISTKTGDSGKTSLWSGDRVAKNHPAIKCVCELDLFDSSLGIVYSKLGNTHEYSDICKTIQNIQSRLVQLKGEIATHPRDWEKFRQKYDFISSKDIQEIESACDEIKLILEDKGYKIKGWVHYGSEGELSAYVDYVRGLCRKSEIEIYELDDTLLNISISENIKKYINRLSDYLYWVARFLRKNA